jgi:protein subunit release factor B
MISEKSWQKLRNKMHELSIKEEDLLENFILSAKKGGQHVNKTSSCVWLKHLPSGIEIKCQQYRSQIENRFHARKILCEKLEEKILGKKSKKQIQIAKIVKQKKRRMKKSAQKYTEAEN